MTTLGPLSRFSADLPLSKWAFSPIRLSIEKAARLLFWETENDEGEVDAEVDVEHKELGDKVLEMLPMLEFLAVMLVVPFVHTFVIKIFDLVYAIFKV